MWLPLERCDDSGDSLSGRCGEERICDDERHYERDDERNLWRSDDS